MANWRTSAMGRGHLSHIRLPGLDLARFLAFCGMVLVNFGVVASLVADTGPDSGFGSAPDSSSFTWVQGRAAALFVVLAGLGLGLSAKHRPASAQVQYRRAGFLLVLGLLNSILFPADILHFYAFYFALGFLCLPLGWRRLLILIFAVNIGFLLMVFGFDYEQGWNWETLDYEGFWTPQGMVRHLFFNGWHPIFPWFGFFLLGMTLAQFDLHNPAMHRRLIWMGGGMLALAMVMSSWLSGQLVDQPDLAILVSTVPIPPTPLYVLAGAGAACLIIGLSLAGQSYGVFRRIEAIVAPAGRQTLTLYMAHILLGMPLLITLQPSGLRPETYAALASLGFILLALLYAHSWKRKFSKGPLEMLMRWLDRV